MYIFARDQAVFKALFFAGDRGADLLSLKTIDILRFPDNSGLLLNHIWTKSLRSGDANVFAFRRGTHSVVCPVKGLELYFDICKSLGIALGSGFLFRSVTRSGAVSDKSLAPQAAQARLNVYISSDSLRGHLTRERYTLHGFRSGVAVSLALAGVSLHEIMDHVGWKSSRTAMHYIKLRQVVNPAGAAAQLADLDYDVGKTYMNLNNLDGFLPLFKD
jgi:integrase